MTFRDGKPCKQCGSTEWYTDGRCAPCVRERNRQWSKNNPEKHAARTRRWAKNNPEKIAEKDRRWYKDNSEKATAYSRQWYKDNHDRATEKRRQWSKDNPEKNIERVNRRRTLKTQAGGSFTTAEWKALCDHYGNRCLCCGRSDVRLTADHIVPVAKGGSSNIDNIQPLCGSCNSRKKDKEIDYRPGTGLGRWIQKKLFG